MTSDFDINARLARSARMLRAWRWMATISNSPADAIDVLTEEALALIRLGPRYPRKSRTIGRLIVAYQHLITQLRNRVETQARPTAANAEASHRAAFVHAAERTVPQNGIGCRRASA